MLGFRRHASSNYPGSDAQLALGPIGRFDISVRCFNKGNIKFQKSKFIGSGRSATSDDLIRSVEDVERVVVVDLRDFPLLSFYPIDSKAILRLIRTGQLTTSGMTPRRFDSWIAKDFSQEVRTIELPVPTPPTEKRVIPVQQKSYLHDHPRVQPDKDRRIKAMEMGGVRQAGRRTSGGDPRFDSDHRPGSPLIRRFRDLYATCAASDSDYRARVANSL